MMVAPLGGGIMMDVNVVDGNEELSGGDNLHSEDVTLGVDVLSVDDAHLALSWWGKGDVGTVLDGVRVVGGGTVCAPRSGQEVVVGLEGKVLDLAVGDVGEEREQVVDRLARVLGHVGQVTEGSSLVVVTKDGPGLELRLNPESGST